MRITKARLHEIIREEIARLSLMESDGSLPTQDDIVNALLKTKVKDMLHYGKGNDNKISIPSALMTWELAIVGPIIDTSYTIQVMDETGMADKVIESGLTDLKTIVEKFLAIVEGPIWADYKEK